MNFLAALIAKLIPGKDFMPPSLIHVIKTPPKKVYKMMSLEQAHYVYSNGVREMDSIFNHPGQPQRSTIDFGLFVDQLRSKGWSIQ